MQEFFRDGSVKRGVRAENLECAEETVREKSLTKVVVDSMYDRESLCIVWKNVRKIRMREKQLELEGWMSMYETGLNGDT